MNILMIAPEPFFEPRGTPFSVLGRLEALSHLGHKVDLLTYHIGKNMAIPGVKILRTTSVRFIKQVPLGPSWIKLFLDILLFAKAFHLLLQRRYDLLYTHEEASFFGILLVKFFRIRHLYDMHSSLPQQLINFRFTHFRPLIRFFEWLERRAINSSNTIITICPALKEHVRRINRHVPQVLIENVAGRGDPQAIPEDDLHTFKVTFSLDEKKVVLYAGSFEPYQGIDLLIAGADRLLRHRKDLTFLLMGGRQDQVKYYQTQVKALGLSSHFSFTGTRPPEEIPIAIRISDILVSPRISGTNTPLKIYSYLQSGKPIVATNLPTHTQVLNSDVAVLVEPDPDAFAKGILSILENPVLARILGKQARQHFENHYNFRAYIEKTEQALQMALR